MRRTITLLTATLVLSAFAPTPEARATKIEDITTILHARDNVLEGVGLVVGLNGTGDSAAIARQLLRNYLSRKKINVTSKELASKNIAVVAVHARFAPFWKEGHRFDVTVATIGDAASLQGGQLLQLTLDGIDGKTYAIASGAVSTGGFTFSGDAAKGGKNHPVVGRVPDGGILEVELKYDLLRGGSHLYFQLRAPQFRTATRVAKAINEAFGSKDAAKATDAAEIRVFVPEGSRDSLPDFIAKIQELKVTPVMSARVVVSERTGTIVAGGDIGLEPVAISHGNLSFSISEDSEVVQPPPFSRGSTRVVPRSDVKIEEELRPLVPIEGATTVTELAAALNAVGISPRDMVIVFQMLKRAGALHAELVIE